MSDVRLSVCIPTYNFGAFIGETHEKTMQILDMAPPARVVFGSDGVVIPEIHWAGAKIGRQVLEDVLGEFIRAKVYDEDEAYEAAKMILAGNAKRVYNPW